MNLSVSQLMKEETVWQKFYALQGGPKKGRRVSEMRSSSRRRERRPQKSINVLSWRCLRHMKGTGLNRYVFLVKGPLFDPERKRKRGIEKPNRLQRCEERHCRVREDAGKEEEGDDAYLSINH